MILKFFFRIVECHFWKNYGKCEKTKRYQTFHNRKKKEIFSIATKFSYYKFFHTKVIGNKNEKKTQILVNKPVY